METNFILNYSKEIPSYDNKLNRPTTKPKIILDLKSAQPAIGFLSETISESLLPDSEYTRMLEANVKEQLEEEIRVFYVACTRAERQIVIASTGSKQQVLQSRMYTEYASISRWLAEMEKIR